MSNLESSSLPYPCIKKSEDASQPEHIIRASAGTHHTRLNRNTYSSSDAPQQERILFITGAQQKHILSFKTHLGSMSGSRLLQSLNLRAPGFSRQLSTALPRLAVHKDRVHPNAEEHREAQKSKLDNPHLANAVSSLHNEIPSVGVDNASPELISSLDPGYVPKNKLPEKTRRTTGDEQYDTSNLNKPDLGVGEMDGIKFKVEPLRRTGEDSTTMRARLLCQYLPV